ncbi:MAG: PQQ-like beta-propeller repeat protein [Planctomycetaceae bacterium]|jgi:outer membrane protein assembly factor BamB|nr:PQQ-like beta-propeller repeat protein [Planctomycetaceae bacterium]
MTTVLETTNVAGVRRLYHLAFWTAGISAVCCVFFAGVLLVNYFGFNGQQSGADADGQTYRREADGIFNLLPINEKTFIEAKQQLAGDKQNDQLKEHVRQLDERLRNDFFRRRTILHRTAPLLLIASIVFFVSMRICSVLNRPLPDNDRQPLRFADRKESGTLRTGAAIFVYALAASAAGVAAGMLLTPSTPLETILRAKIAAKELPETEPVLADTAVSAPLPVDVTAEPAVEPALVWTSFRGSGGNGIGISDKPPVKWNAVTGENVVWKTEVPLPGKSSPIIWNTKLFVTGADEKTQQIYCFDTATGKMLWNVDATTATGSVKVSEDTGFAAPTPATDGQHIFAIFANGELAAADFTGKIVWRKSFGVPESTYGYASSPAIHNGKVIVQYDVGDGSGAKSKIVALDAKSGKTVWETARTLPNSWSSPTLQKIGGQYQVITCGDPFVIAYNPDDGKEIWRCKCLSADVGPSPIASGSVVFVTNQSPRSTAIDATGSGDVTATHILWQGTNAMPDTPSPFAAADRFFTFDSGGYLTAYDPKSAANKRAKFWELEVGGGESGFYASPLLVGNLVYLFSRTEAAAKAFVVDLSKAATDDSGALSEESAKAMQVAENPMPEPCVASPAVIQNRLYIRGTKTIFCIEQKTN